MTRYFTDFRINYAEFRKHLVLYMLRLRTNYSVVPWGGVAFNATQLQNT